MLDWKKPGNYLKLNLMKDRIALSDLTYKQSKDIQEKMFEIGGRWKVKDGYIRDTKGFQINKGVMCYGIMEAYILTYEEFLNLYGNYKPTLRNIINPLYGIL